MKKLKKLKQRVQELEDSVFDHDADVQHMSAQIVRLAQRLTELESRPPREVPVPWPNPSPPFWQGPMCSSDSRNENDLSSMVTMPAEVFGVMCDRAAQAVGLLERCESLLNTNPSLHHDVSKWLNEFAVAEEPG